MSLVLAVTNQKGGVGKTTTAVNLTASLAYHQQRVLLVDLDPQGNATTGCGVERSAVEQSIYEVLCQGQALSAVVHRCGEHPFDLAPANGDLTAAEVELMSVMSRETRLKRALQACRADYDFILIDCPPSLNLLTLNALVAADAVLIPVQCEYYALEGLSALLQTISEVKQSINPELRIEGMLRTMYDGRANLANEVSEQLREHFGEQLYRTIIPRNVRLAEAPSHGLPVLSYDQNSRGALAYLSLAGELVRRQAKVETA